MGDINNDGWVDVYFTSNQSENKLYLNQGDLLSKTLQRRQCCGSRAWSTGVAMVDINAVLLDIYVCNSGDIAGDKKENKLFIIRAMELLIESAKPIIWLIKDFYPYYFFRLRYGR